MRCALLLIFVVTLGVVLRVPRLNVRPVHGDEAVHAYKFNELWTGKGYQYDPHEYHGPTLNYSTLPFLWLRGAGDYSQVDIALFRFVPVLFGLGLVLLLPLVADGLGRWAALAAGVLTAVSPLMVFCSRHYVQETLLVFFVFAVIALGWRFARTRRPIWAVLAGLAAGLAHATKETCVIAFAALLAALLGPWLWQRFVRRVPAAVRRPFPWRPLLSGAAAAVVISVVLFSAFFTHWKGSWDSIRTFSTYFERGVGGSVHDHPWDYYLRMLLYTHYAPGPVWSEALIVVLAAAGMAAALFGKGPGDARPAFVRFLAVYTLLMVLVYSALPYKTPWSMLGMLHGLILLAGVGAVSLLRRLKHLPFQVPVALLLLAVTAQLGVQSYRTNLDPRFVTDTRNPYVYAQPLRGVVLMGSFVERLAAAHPDGRAMLVKVIMPNAWPVPWYLRRLEAVGYWEDPPLDCDAPVIVTATDAPAGLEDRLNGAYERFSYGLRADVTIVVYVNTDLMDRFRAAERAAAGEGK